MAAEAAAPRLTVTAAHRRLAQRRLPSAGDRLTEVAFSGIAFSMQQLLVSWLLVGILLLPGDSVGLVQGAIGIPGIALMLWGGASADRTDPRSLLMRVYLVAPLVPLGLWVASRTIGIELITARPRAESSSAEITPPCTTRR